MKTQKTVYNKLSKIVKPSEQKEELSAEKVELALVDDLKSYSRGINNYESEGNGLVKRKMRLAQELEETNKALYKWSEVGNSLADDVARTLSQFKKAAAEFGIDADKSPEYKDASQAFDKYARLAQKYEQESK